MILPPDFVPHWREGLPDDQYHADKTFVSSSALRKLLKSPRAFQQSFLLGKAEPPSKDMVFGRLVHQVILDGSHFLKTYKVLPKFTEYGHPNSNLHKQAKAAWIAQHAGCTIVTATDFDHMRYMIDSVIDHQDAFNLLKNGVPEISGYYRDEATGIACRIRPDFLNADARAVVDLKTTKSCEIEKFSRSIWDFRYDVQLSMYGTGTAKITGQKYDMHAYIALEKKKPYECAVYVADQAMVEIGERDYHKALGTLRKCLDHNHFPRYQENMRTIGLPGYVLNAKGEWE